jgi:hypothetical protein
MKLAMMTTLLATMAGTPAANQMNCIKWDQNNCIKWEDVRTTKWDQINCMYKCDTGSANALSAMYAVR